MGFVIPLIELIESYEIDILNKYLSHEIIILFGPWIKDHGLLVPSQAGIIALDL